MTIAIRIPMARALMAARITVELRSTGQVGHLPLREHWRNLQGAK
jgi:hypothetical protein